MPEEILVLSILAIGCGTAMIIFITKNIFDIIKAKANLKSGSGEINPQFFKALGDFKKNTERRMANLESIVADLEEEKIRIHDTPKAGEIEIEDKEIRSVDEKDDDSNLKNMLNE